MSGFAQQQSDFQRAILVGDEQVLTEILDSPKEKREVLFGVYKHAYASRLIDTLRDDHKLLHSYVGDEMFDEMGRGYVAAHPSHHPNLRWFSGHFPDFLKSSEPDYPILTELAALEKALNDAFDAKDAPVVGLDDMASFAPEIWNQLKLDAHPSCSRLDVSTNVAAVWLSLKNEEMPPDVVTLEQPERLLIWRHDVTPMFREMSIEEAMMWDEAGAGVPFGVLCSMLATYDDPDGAAARGAGYLHGWITAGLLAGVSV
jgi:hypothetical protein